jgi:hypothetical protein
MFISQKKVQIGESERSEIIQALRLMQLIYNMIFLHRCVITTKLIQLHIRIHRSKEKPHAGLIASVPTLPGT